MYICYFTKDDIPGIIDGIGADKLEPQQSSKIWSKLVEFLNFHIPAYI